MDIKIGEEIKRLRKEKGLKISDLATKSNLSAGMISQVERDMVSPSISTLWKITQALNVSIGYFFDEEPKTDTSLIVRRNERKKISASNNNAMYELLSPDLNRKIEFLYITIKPGDSSSLELLTHEGEEGGIVIKGTLKILMEDKEYILNEGDSIYFDSTIPHRYVNIGEEICESIWAMTPPSF